MQIRVGGRLLDTIGEYGEVSVEERWPLGCYEASWSMTVRPGWRHPALAVGSTVDVVLGPQRLFRGKMSEADWGEGSFTAAGLCRSAESLPALSGSGPFAPTTSPATAAATAAASFGWGISVDGNVPAASITSTATGVTMLSALLDEAADATNQGWAVDEDGHLYFAADPTTPTWILSPGVVELGQTSEAYVSRVFVTYVNASAGGAVNLASAGSAGLYGDAIQTADITSRGPTSPATAQGIASNLLARSGARLGWVNSIEVQRGQLTNQWGQAAAFPMVRAGQMVRVMGAYDELAAIGFPYVDVVIGRRILHDDGSMSLEPAGMVADTFDQIIESVTTAAGLATVAA